MHLESSKKKGSYNGIPFEVQESQSEFGRRNAIFEFPGRDTPHTLDLGRKARKFTITCIVVGEDYAYYRDALIDQVESKNEPGKLIHPYLDTENIKVRPESITVKERATEQQVADIEIVFIEAGSSEFPTGPGAATDVNISRAAQNARQVAKNHFKQIYDTAKSTADQIKSVRERFQNSVKNIKDVAKSVSQTANAITNISYEARKLAQEIDDTIALKDKCAKWTKDAVDSLIKFEPRAKKTLLSLLKYGSDIVSTPLFEAIAGQSEAQKLRIQAENNLIIIDKKLKLDVIANLADSIYYTVSPQARNLRNPLLLPKEKRPTEIAKTEKIRVQNEKAGVIARAGEEYEEEREQVFIEQQVEIETKKIAESNLPKPVDVPVLAEQNTDYISYEDIKIIEKKTLEMINDEVKTTKDPLIINALYQVKNAIVDSVRAAKLKKTRKIEIKEPTCSILLAHIEAGGLKDEGAIIAINRLKNPLIIESGTVLELPNE
jgi:prophage DNA circulation protein